MQTEARDDGRSRRGVGVAVLVGAVGLLLVGVAVWQLWPGREVLLVGDSILRQTGPSLDAELGWPQEVRNEAVNGSGLITPSVFDWEAELPAMLEGDPDVVVVLFIGNYTDTDLPTTADGAPIEFGSPEFFEAWGTASERLATTLLDAGVEVRWVLPPPVLDPALDPVVQGIRAEYLAVAERHPEIVLVDSFEVLATEDGDFLAQVPGDDGQVVPLRAGDGVHLDQAGADRLAQQIADSL